MVSGSLHGAQRIEPSLSIYGVQAWSSLRCWSAVSASLAFLLTTAKLALQIRHGISLRMQVQNMLPT